MVQNGVLSANGNAVRANSTRAGGGSGGGIFVLCRRFEGGMNAVMRADGGNGGTDRTGGGGGGRIAVWYGVDSALFPNIIAGQLRSYSAEGVTYDAYLGALSVTYGKGYGLNGVPGTNDQNGEPGTIGFFETPPTGTVIVLR